VDNVLNPVFKPNCDAEAVAFMPLLRELLLDLGQESCSEKGNLTAAQMKEIFKLGLLGVRQTKRLSPPSTQQIWEPKSWRSLHQNLKTSRLKASPALQKMCEQVARMSEDVPSGKPSAKNANPVASKRKVEEVNSDDVTTTTPKKSKRKKVKGDTI
jgi:DNA polymerase phi